MFLDSHVMCDMANAMNMLRGLLACRNHAGTAAALIASELLSLWSDSLFDRSQVHLLTSSAMVFFLLWFVTTTCNLSQ